MYVCILYEGHAESNFRKKYSRYKKQINTSGYNSFLATKCLLSTQSLPLTNHFSPMFNKSLNTCLELVLSYTSLSSLTKYPTANLF